MKKISLVLMALVLSLSAYSKDIRELVVTTNPPMSCQNCENKIKGNLRFEKGVKKIETNLAEQRVMVEYDADKTNPENIENAFQKIGYKVDIIENINENCAKKPKCQNANGACCQGNGKTEKNCCK